MSTIRYDDQTFNLDTVKDQMDEALYGELRDNYESDQDFFDAYVVAHTEKYGERFVVS
jgi:hypothetical protein